MSGRTNRNKAKPPARRPGPAQQGSRSRIAASNGREMLVAERSYSGPLPEPADLKAFDLIVPGSAKDIIDAFVQQGSHRRAQEARVVDGSERRAAIGQVLAFILLLTGVAGGCVDAALGEGVAGATIAGAAFASGALTYFIGGRVGRDDQ